MYIGDSVQKKSNSVTMSQNLLITPASHTFLTATLLNNLGMYQGYTEGDITESQFRMSHH